VNKFKIGEPCDLPFRGRGEYGKWNELLERVRSMANGKVLPLEFEDYGKAQAWANGRSGRFRQQGVRTQRRGNVVYLSKLPDGPSGDPS